MNALFQVRLCGTGSVPGRQRIRELIPSGDLKVWTGRKPRFFKLGCPGLVKQYAEPNLTMMDYDQSEAPAISRFWDLSRKLGVSILRMRYDRTRRGWHVLIWWAKRFKPIEIIALQAIFGSDPNRELFNFQRIHAGGGRSRRWNLLFERKL